MNVPMGDAAAMRVVGYYTKFGGWVDALGPGGGKDVNSGERTGGRLSFTYKPSRDAEITPRFVSPKTTADGFNRPAKHNPYAKPFPPTDPPGTLPDRHQK